jgi:hypothetical protein
VTEVIVKVRAVLGLAMAWLSLAYGVFVAAVEPAWTEDELKIVLGAETIVLALVSFVWIGHRRPLGLALVATGVAVPLIMLATAPLYWDEVLASRGEAFWTSVAIGSVVGAPVVALGAVVFACDAGTDRRRDPWWIAIVRWAILLGMWIMVLAFRGDDWERGVALVAVGGTLALVGVLVAAARRLRVRRHGIGLLLLFLGSAGLAVLVVSKVFVGSHMSTAEAMPAMIAAVAVTAAGALTALKRPRTGSVR